MIRTKELPISPETKNRLNQAIQSITNRNTLLRGISVALEAAANSPPEETEKAAQEIIEQIGSYRQWPKP